MLFRSITLGTSAINNAGTITLQGSGTGATTISGVIGTNVTNVIQNSATSSLTLSGVNTFTNNGTISVSSGTLNINGNLYDASTGLFNQSGGDINIDGNAAGVTGNSVATGTYLLGLYNYVNWTGGTLTLVDPPASTSTSQYSVYYSASTYTDVSPNHTFRFGDGVSSTAGGNAQGYYIYLWPSTGRLDFGNVTVNGPASGTALSTNRILKTYSYGIPVRGNLLITNKIGRAHV